MANIVIDKIINSLKSPIISHVAMDVTVIINTSSVSVSQELASVITWEQYHFYTPHHEISVCSFSIRAITTR